MSDVAEGLPIIPHLAGEFYTWLWWSSEVLGSAFELGAPWGAVDLWVDERLCFRNADDTRVATVMTGENPAGSLEARAALAGGKVLQEIRLGMRREDREYFFTLKGPSMHVTALKLPQVVKDGGEEVFYERIHLYDELCFLLAGLLARFGQVRSTPQWQREVLPGLHDWILGKIEGPPARRASEA
jgi:hypothetical protein